MSYSGNSSYSLAGPISNNYSTLENIAYHSSSGQSSNINYLAEAVSPQQTFYHSPSKLFQLYQNSTQTLYNIQKTQPTNVEYSFIPDNFILPGQTKRFIGDTEQIQEEIQEAFLKTTNKELPPNINISVCSSFEFKKIIDQPGVKGISINRQGMGISEIFVLNNDLAQVMLTIDHEIGHVLTKSLKDKRLEEAKAFAFSKAWMKTIKEHNIADLKNSIVLENPARNGIHDIAHSFVNKIKNKNPLQLYWEIVRGKHAIAL